MTTLPLFWHLSSASKAERIEASVKLIGALQRFQAQFSPKDLRESETSEDEEDKTGEKYDHLDALNAQDVSYSIKRLIRGLASPRECSRLGFAVALTELLSRIDTVTCSQIVALIVESSKTHGSMNGQEERDVLFARLFGFTAVIQSGLLVRTQPLRSSTPSSDLSTFQAVLDGLIALGDKKSWLRESAWWTIALVVDVLKESNVSWKERAVLTMTEKIFLENKTWSPEKVALALKLQHLDPNQNWTEFVAPAFKSSDLLSGGNLSNLARILKESTTESGDFPTSSAAVWKPQVHFVWDIILDHLLRSPSISKGSFQEFFRVVVDESLFCSSASAERKYWGFQIFQKALPGVNGSNLPMLFTKNFMRTWINHLSHHDRYLHKAARQVATEIQSFVQSNPTLGFTLILQLTGVNGSHQFDKLTKTKTVESILTSMDTEGIKSYIDFLLMQFNEEDAAKPDIQTVNSKRIWTIDQLSTLIRNSVIPKSDDWVQLVLDWLIVHALFIVKKKSGKSTFQALRSVPSPPLSEKLRQHCATRLLSCLADLTGQTTLVKSGDKTTKVTAVASDGEFWVSKALTTIKQLEKDTKHVTRLFEVGEEDQTLHVRARELSGQLSQITGEMHDAAKGAELLLLATLLQQYCPNDKDEVDTDSLKACIDGATRMFFVTSKDAESAMALHAPVDIFVDIVIGFLEKSTSYLRAVGNQVFSLLTSAIQESTVDLILTQLERRDPTTTAEDDDDEVEVDDDEEEEGEGEGGEDDKKMEDDESDSEKSSSSNQNEDEGSSHESTDDELRKKIKVALKNNGVEAASETDPSSDSEELMDDDQMLAMDHKLAAVFKAKAGEKKSGKGVDAQREATHFKNRVLALLDTFIQKQPSSPLIIRLILPLVELITSTSSDEQQLQDKAKSLLQSRVGKSKEVPSVVDTMQATQVLDDLHTRARKAHSPDASALLNQCSLYLVKVLLHSDAELPILVAYRQSLADFISRKNSSLTPNFFQDFFRLHPILAWNLRSDLIELSSKAVNVYRRCQVFQLLQILVARLPTMGERSEEISDFMPSLRRSLFDFLCDETISLNTHQMKDLLKVGMLAIRQTKKALSPGLIHTVWKPEIWVELAASKRFKPSPSLQAMCKQMARISQSPSITETTETGNKVAITKRKVDECDGDAASKGGIRKGSKKSKVA